MDQSPCPEPDGKQRRSPWRRLGRFPNLNPPSLLGIGFCVVLWVVASAPQSQQLEGALRLSAISFVLQPPAGDTSDPTLLGFLALPLRNLTIKGLAEESPLVVPLSGQSLEGTLKNQN